MARVLAIVPFFGGTSSATHSLEETRLGYLEATVRSIEEQLGVVPVICQTADDKVRLPHNLPTPLRIPTDPIWLPYAACKWAQDWVYQAHNELEYVYYSEADQVLHMHDEDVLGFATDEQYVAPWRLDKVGPNGECELEGSAQIEIDGERYAIANGAHHIPRDGTEEDKWGVVDIHAQQQAFSGAWLATRAYFLRVPFRKMRVLPVEHASGFDVKSIGDCVKTAWVERFWIDHLSPRDRWAQPQESDTE